MEKSSLIMGIFFAATSSYTIFENQQHIANFSQPDLYPISDAFAKISDPIVLPPPVDISSEFCCDQSLVTNPFDDLKNALKRETFELKRLQQTQSAYNQQLKSVYEANYQVRGLESNLKGQQYLQKGQEAKKVIDHAIQNWAVHEAEINQLAAKNSSYRQHYLKEEENIGYALNLSMNAERRKKDSQRAAIDARIQYLNELYRHQQSFMQKKMSAYNGIFRSYRQPAYY